MAHTLINKEMLAVVVREALGNAIKLYGMADVQAVEHDAGAIIKLPKVGYIGDATVVEAGQPIPLTDFAMTVAQVEVKKVAKALKFTVEDINNAYIDLQKECELQITKAIANAVEKAMVANLGEATLTVTNAEWNIGVIADAIALMGDQDIPTYLLVNAKDYAKVRVLDDVIMNANHNGAVANAGVVLGANIIVTNNVNEGEAFLMGEKAIGLFLKQDVLVEEQKDVLTQTLVIAGTEHFVTYLKDETKAVKITIG